MRGYTILEAIMALLGVALLGFGLRLMWLLMQALERYIHAS